MALASSITDLSRDERYIRVVFSLLCPILSLMICVDIPFFLASVAQLWRATYEVKGSKEYRFEGYGYGGGISYGYNFFLGIRWSIEANLGIGYARLHYDKYKCQKCGEKIGTESRNYFGPTKAGISLIYYLK